MACPICHCEKFYIKDPQDSFEIREFELVNGQIRYDEADTDHTDLEVTQACEIFCQRCAWHGAAQHITQS